MSIISRSEKGTRRASATVAAAAPLAARTMPKQPKPYTKMVATALVALVFAAAAGVLFLKRGNTVEVLTINADVPAGHVMARSDLAETSVSGVTGSIPVTDVDSVVGKRTAVGLVEGQLLTDGDLTTTELPAGNERVVSISLSAGRVPATLSPGAVVNVLAVPASSGDGTPAATGPGSESGSLSSPQVLTSNAEIYSESTSQDGSTVLTLLVSVDDANVVAAYNAAGQVTVVQAPVASGSARE